MHEVRQVGRLVSAGAAVAFFSFFAAQADAVLFYATGDASYNTSAPTGALTNSGWQYEGYFNGFQGTAVAPHFFLTTKHIGGSIGNTFVLDGTNYTTDASYDDPGSEMRLWHVTNALPRYAATYTNSSEVDAPMLVIGRGTERGTPVVVTDGLTNGWFWGTDNRVMRWGSNRVARIDYGGVQYLLANLDPDAGPDECSVSVGDSGGATFIFADGRWQLAGIIYGVDGPFNTTNTGVGFNNAAIYDTYGLYTNAAGSWVLSTNHTAMGFASSRVSSRYAWLTNAIPDFDSNANGIPDWWEQQYSGNGQGMSATNDPDLDGFDNLAEWSARTDPSNSNSFFQISAVSWTNGVGRITFQGWSNRLYRTFMHDAPLSNGTWRLVTTNAFAGLDGPTTWLDTNLTAAVTSRFYRVDVSLPP